MKGLDDSACLTSLCRIHVPWGLPEMLTVAEIGIMQGPLCLGLGPEAEAPIAWNWERGS